MEIKLQKPFEHDGTRFEKVTVPDYIQVGHRRAYAKHKGLDQEEAGFALCAALCELPEAAFDRLSLQDFERVTAAVRRLFEGSAEKEEITDEERNIARVVRIMHKEYGFSAGEVLRMREDECVFWLSSLDMSASHSSDDMWENAE